MAPEVKYQEEMRQEVNYLEMMKPKAICRLKAMTEIREAQELNSNQNI
jgi:hypothetical protein